MLKIFALLFIVLSLNAAASQIHTGRIAHIDFPKSHSELPLIYLSDGYVLKVSGEEKNYLEEYIKAQKAGLVMKFSVDEDRNILAGQVLRKSEPALPEVSEEENGEYRPSLLLSLQDANTVFNSLRRGWSSSSQCYNRAHVWTYESKKKYNLDAMKVFIFYTRKYIREYNFYWWFHVAPFTYVREGGVPTQRVLDPRFTRSPLLMKDWTDIFMNNNAVCPEITRYSQYANNQESQYCYLYKASMYYVQPLDLDNLETKGTVKTQFYNYEVKRAYRNGFGVWSY